MNNLTEILRQELVVLEDARDIFQHSFEKCSGIGLKSDFTYEELESMDGFMNPKGGSEMAWNHDRRSFPGGQNFLNVAKNNVIMIGYLMSKFGIVF
jgi:hypothetical protein